jgi:hypothetical protein
MVNNQMTAQQIAKQIGKHLASTETGGERRLSD